MSVIDRDDVSCSDDVVRELHRLGRPAMAAWVKRLDAKCTDANRRERELVDIIHTLRAKEPRPERHDATPPPEASD